MPTELRIPAVGESVTEVEIGDWLKHQGERVRKDEPVVVIESEKATVELPAPETGTLSRLLKQKGDTAKVGEIIGYLDAADQAGQPERTPPTAETTAPINPPIHQSINPVGDRGPTEPKPGGAQPIVMPAARRALAEQGLRAAPRPP